MVALRVLGSVLESSWGTLGDLMGTHGSLQFRDRCPKGSREGLGDTPGTILESIWVALGSSWGAPGELLGTSEALLGALGAC